MVLNSADVQRLAAEIHAGTTRLVIAVTGGGSGAISALLGSNPALSWAWETKEEAERTETRIAVRNFMAGE